MNKKELVLFIKESKMTAPDQVAVKGMELYEMWVDSYTDEAGNIIFINYEVGDRRRYECGNGEVKLFKCKQAHTSQSSYAPEATPALWDVIDIEHEGTIEDPIPYDLNMIVFKDKYYTYEGELYICTRDSGQPLYNTPDNLIDAGYFTVV